MKCAVCALILSLVVALVALLIDPDWTIGTALSRRLSFVGQCDRPPGCALPFSAAIETHHVCMRWR
jgi:hypothetical protein